MPCNTPLKARYVESCGKKQIIFANEYTDFSKGSQILLPCGRCIGCRLDYARQWAVRCVHESSLHDQNCFITLTFSPEHLPKNGSLNKRDFQLFMKKLRKKYPKKIYGHIGYYQCGEYGENNDRPHYHACLFNFDFPDKKLWKTSNGQRLYVSEILNEIWGLGYCVIGDVTFESAAYVARYITKKIKGEKSHDYYGNKLPEYTTCSRRPAIGLNWLEKYHKDVYNYDGIHIDGKYFKPSRYYDNYLKKNNEEKYNEIKEKRFLVMQEKKSDIENSVSRMNTKHEVLLLKHESISRDYEKKLTFKNTLDDAQESYDAKCIEYYNMIQEIESQQKENYDS